MGSLRQGFLRAISKTARGEKRNASSAVRAKGRIHLSFDEEFWIAKQGDWGFQVEAVPHMSRSYDKGGSGALAGGSLAAFWTKRTGVVVLGRLPDKWNDVTWDKITAWPTHHLWGRTAQGSAFSSARQWHPWVHYDFQTEGADRVSQVHVMGSLGPDQTVETEDVLDNGHVYYRRKFTLRENGIHVQRELVSRGEDQITELWETLPIFLNPTRPRGKINGDSETTIEFQFDGDWRPGSQNLTDGVNAVRLRRHECGVIIEFDAPQSVALSEVFTTRYQKTDRLQTVNIDLLPGNETPQAMPRRARVSYLIRAE